MASTGSPEDPTNSLFVVKKHSRFDSEVTGIACTVKKKVNGKERIFLLTCKETQSNQENIFAHCACERQWWWFLRKHKPIGISNSREEGVFSFTAVIKSCSESLSMVSEDEDTRRKLAEGLKDDCCSFVNDGNSFRTVRWLYQKDQKRHYMRNADLPKQTQQALGSPVLWTDDRNRTFVVGVVGYDSLDRKLCPNFFTERALLITEVPMPVQMNELPPKVKELPITLTWNTLQDEREPIEKYTVYQRNLNGVSEWTELTTLENRSVSEYSVRGLKSGEKYEFLVTATNRYGEGLKGEGVKVKVSKDVPMPVEFNVNSRGAKSDTFTLTWVEPNNSGAVVLDYMVYRRDLNEDGRPTEWKFVDLVPASQNLAWTEHVITLHRGKTFDLVVTAKNKCGESAKEEDSVKRVEVPADVPMPVELTDVPSFVNTREIRLKWKMPKDNGAPITGYLVYQRSVGQDGAQSDWKLIRETADCQYRIKLERGQKLDFTITAKNKCGESLKKEENAKRVEVSVWFKDPKYLYAELISLLHRFVLPLSDIAKRVQDLEANFGNAHVRFGRLLVLSLLGVLVLLCFLMSGIFGFGSLFLILLTIIAVWHFWQTGDIDFQVIEGHFRQMLNGLSQNIPPRVQELKEKFETVTSQFLDLFLMGIAAVCFHWIVGSFVNIGFGSLLLLLLGILAVWHLWRKDVFENVGFGVLVLSVLGILALWCLWSSGFIGFGFLLLCLLGIAVALHFWKTGDEAGYQAFQSHVRQLQTKVERFLPRPVQKHLQDILAGIQKIIDKAQNFTTIGFELLIGILAVCCLWATGFFVNVGFLVLFFLGILSFWFLWRAEYFVNFGLRSTLVLLVLGITVVGYQLKSLFDGKKIKQ